jgi:hypothetical protein
VAEGRVAETTVVLEERVELAALAVVVAGVAVGVEVRGA